LGVNDSQPFSSPTYNSTVDEGTITVDATGFESAAWLILPDPGGGNDSGIGSLAAFAAVPDTYTCLWGDNIPGYSPPAPQQFILVDEGSITFGPPGYSLDTGSVSVTINDQNVTWTLTGPNSYDSGSQTGDQVIGGLPAGGPYIASFDDNIFDKLRDPGTAQGTILKDQVLNLTQTYTSRGTYTVNITTQEDGGAPPADFGSWSIANNEGFSFTAAGDSDTNHSPVVPSVGDFYDGRTYTVTWGAETGYTPPVPQQITVASTKIGSYTTTASGDIEVVITGMSGGDEPDWTLYGPSGYSYDGTGSETVNGVNSGDYYVKWGWMDDYWPPRPYDDNKAHASQGAVGPEPWADPIQNFTGATITFTGAYTNRLSEYSDMGAKSKVGLNIQWARGWTKIYYFTDRFRQAERWYHDGNTGENQTGLSLTKDYTYDDGWVHTIGGTGQSGFSFKAYTGKGTGDGNRSHKIYAEGTGRLRIYEGAALRYDVVWTAGVPAGGVDTVSLWTEEDCSNSLAYAVVSGLAAYPNHLRNMQCVLDDSATSQDFATGVGADHLDPEATMFLPQCLNIHRNCRVLRFKWPTVRDFTAEECVGGVWSGTPDWSLPGRSFTGPTPKSRWSNRDMYQGMVDMCNALDCDLWAKSPIWNNASFWQGIGSLVETAYVGGSGGGLKTSLNWYYEVGNELWLDSGNPNMIGQYAKNLYSSKRGTLGFPSSGFSSFQELLRGQAWLTWAATQEIMPYVTANGGTLKNRFRPLFASQTKGSQFKDAYNAEGDVEFVASEKAIDSIFGWSDAPYTVRGPDGHGAWTGSEPAPEAGNVAAQNSYITEWMDVSWFEEKQALGSLGIINWMNSSEAIASADDGRGRPSVGYIAYEGGVHTRADTFSDAVRNGFRELHYERELMYDLVFLYLDTWFNATTGNAHPDDSVMIWYRNWGINDGNPDREYFSIVQDHMNKERTDSYMAMAFEDWSLLNKIA